MIRPFAQHRWWIVAMAISYLCGGPWVPRALATDRYYRDQTVVSTNGRYRLEAKSPDNAGPSPHPFASHFVYSLYDTLTGDLVWQRGQPEDEGSPMSVFLHDQAWVTIQTGRNELVVLHPVTAEVTGRFDILEQFTDSERNDYVHSTTAGPMWEEYSHWYYVEDGFDLYFVVRPFWAHRIVIDVPRGRLADGTDGRIVQLCLAAERKFVTTTLANGVRLIDQLADDEQWEFRSEVETAAIIAAQNHESSALSYLRVLQQSDANSWGVSQIPYVEYDGGQIDPSRGLEMDVRSLIQDAMRLLGDRPTELPCSLFGRKTGDEETSYIRWPELPAARATRVDLVQRGARPQDVLKALGAPDYLDRWEARWEYHMDTDTPYTLRIIFDENDDTVSEIERETPPIWQQGSEWIERHRW